jgi:hypothetical protein
MGRGPIEELHIVSLAVGDQLRFAEALINPPALPVGMERARDAHARLIGNSTDAAIPD